VTSKNALNSKCTYHNFYLFFLVIIYICEDMPLGDAVISSQMYIITKKNK